MKRIKPKVTIKSVNLRSNRSVRKQISLGEHLHGCTKSSVPGNRINSVDQEKEHIQFESQGAVHDVFQMADTNHASLNVKKTNYQKYKENAIGHWTAIRDSILRVQVEKSAPLSLECVSCGEQHSSVVMCTNCGPHYVECHQCCVATHKLRPFHKLEEWKVCITYLTVTVTIIKLKYCLQ